MCDCEVPTVSNVEERRARKPHRCCECRRTIGIGERHQHVRALFDGSWSTDRTCLDCASVRTWLQAQPWACDCIAVGELAAAVREAEVQPAVWACDLEIQRHAVVVLLGRRAA